MHPELSFRHLSGAPMPHRKRSWAGAAARFAALKDAGIVVPAEVGVPGAVAAVDDLLDAAVAAWTASRYPTVAT